MATEAPRTIGEAIEGVTEEDLNAAEETDEEVDETTDDDDDADDSSETETEEDDSDDESDDDDESDEYEDDDDDESDEDDEKDADWGVDDKEGEDGDTDFFDELSQEQLAEIKKHPELNALRKQLMKGYEKKTTQHSNLVKLGEAYRKNPLGTLQAIADQLGVKVVKPTDETETKKETDAPTKVEIAAAKIEKLFGVKAGPPVREALKEFVDAVNEQNMKPVNDRLTEADAEAEKVRFLKEEADFRERHSKALTPEIEEAVVKLGESGKFAPGKNMTAGEYLDTLLEVALAKEGKTLGKTAGREASKKLKAKIDRNKREREPRGRGAKSGVRKVSRLQKDPGSFKSLGEAMDAAAEEMDDDFEDGF